MVELRGDVFLRHLNEAIVSDQVDIVLAHRTPGDFRPSDSLSNAGRSGTLSGWSNAFMTPPSIWPQMIVGALSTAIAYSMVAVLVL